MESTFGAWRFRLLMQILPCLRLPSRGDKRLASFRRALLFVCGVQTWMEIPDVVLAWPLEDTHASRHCFFQSSLVVPMILVDSIRCDNSASAIRPSPAVHEDTVRWGFLTALESC
jgi:hypothetical protein